MTTSPPAAPLSIAQKGFIYEQTLAAEYLSWLTAWNERHPSSGFFAERIGGTPEAPIVTVAGPSSALIDETLGLGTQGSVTAETVERVLDVYRRAGSDHALIELSPHADPSALEHANAFGFRLRSFLDVYFLHLSDLVRRDTNPAVTVRRVDTTDPVDTELAARVISLGRSEQDLEGEPNTDDLLIAQQVVSCPRVATFLAEIDGKPAGGSSIGIHRGHPLTPSHANLFNGSTLPARRGRGVQTALMLARLDWADRQGVRTASLDCHPTVATGRNARRLGFEMLYTKPVLKRPMTPTA